MPGIHHPNRDLIWASETIRDRPEAQWWMLAADGTWQHLSYLPRERRVLGHGKTRLAPASIEPLFAALGEEGFFDLATHYPPSDVPVEGDIVVVVARLGSWLTPRTFGRRPWSRSWGGCVRQELESLTKLQRPATGGRIRWTARGPSAFAAAGC
jgi:hypothetical protein